MYRKFNILQLTSKERNDLDKLMKKNPDKGYPNVYYTTDFCVGVGYMIIATYDKPKRTSMFGKFDFGDFIDITDYDSRVNTF